MKSSPHPWNSENNEKHHVHNRYQQKEITKKHIISIWGVWASGGKQGDFFFFFPLSPGAGWIHDLPYVRENPNKPLNNIFPKGIREISRRIFQKWLESKDTSKDLLFGIILTINLLTQTCFHFLHVKKHQVFQNRIRKREKIVNDCII